MMQPDNKQKEQKDEMLDFPKLEPQKNPSPRNDFDFGGGSGGGLGINVSSLDKKEEPPKLQ